MAIDSDGRVFVSGVSGSDFCLEVGMDVAGMGVDDCGNVYRADGAASGDGGRCPVER